MPDINEALQSLISETIEDFRGTGSNLYDQFLEEDRQTVEDVLRRIAELQVDKIRSGSDADRIKENLDHNYNTLLNLAAKAEVVGRNEFVEFLNRLTNRIINTLIAVLVVI